MTGKYWIKCIGYIYDLKVDHCTKMVKKSVDPPDMATQEEKLHGGYMFLVMRKRAIKIVSLSQ